MTTATMPIHKTTAPPRVWMPPAGGAGRFAVDVDAAHAHAWLARNIATNRKVIQRNIERIASDMREGRWVYDGSPIRFDRDGNLIDGQNRLRAVLAAEGGTYRMDVVYGLENRAFSVIDTGCVRNGAHALQFDGKVNTALLAATARLLCQWDPADGLIAGHYNKAITNQTIVETVRDNPELEESARFVVNHKGVRLLCPPSTTTFCHFLFCKINRADADQFFLDIADGSNLPKGDGRHLMAKWLQNYRNRGQKSVGGLGSVLFVGLWIKSWNMWRTRQTGEFLSFRASEKFPLPV